MAADQNPYSPPQAHVADAERAEARRRRPVAIIIALVLVGISFLLGMAGIVSLGRYVQTAELAPIDLAWPIVRLLLLVAIGVGIARGLNWARIVFAVLTAFALASLVNTWANSAVFSPGPAYPGAWIMLVVSGIPVLLNLLTVYLLFHPGRSWFQRR